MGIGDMLQIQNATKKGKFYSQESYEELEVQDEIKERS